MNDVRRLNELRREARASYYCCRRQVALVTEPLLRAALERGAFARWRLARSIDTYLVAQPAEGRSRLEPTLGDFAQCLVLRARTALSNDPDLHGLRWLADDSAQLRHSVEISRGLTWSLHVSDFLSARLDELKQVQRTVAALEVAMPARSRTHGAPEPQSLATT